MYGKKKKGFEMIKERDFELSQERNYYVVQHNDLIQKSDYSLIDRAGKSLTLSEQKILLYIISKIKPDAAALEPIVFDIQSFCDVLGIPSTGSGRNYQRLKNDILHLASRVMWLCDHQSGDEVTVRYIDKARIKPKVGKIELQLDEDLRPYLLNLANNYTQFNLHNVLRMKSQYGVRLYQLLRSYVFTGSAVRFALDDLKGNLDATQYANLKDFKSRVLTPALKDINTYSDLAVSVEYEKTGRTTTHVVFTLQDLEKPRSPEAAAEAQRRYTNVEREIDPDQMIIDSFPEVTP